MAAEDNERGAGQGRGMPTAGSRRHTFNLGEGPEPFAVNFLLVVRLVVLAALAM